MLWVLLVAGVGFFLWRLRRARRRKVPVSYLPGDFRRDGGGRP